jgi:hypothetical protein
MIKAKFPKCVSLGIEPFDISGMSHEGHKKPRYVVLVDDLDRFCKPGQFSTIIISGGKEAVWAEEVEKYLGGNHE